MNFTLQQVLALIDAEPIPDADALARMPIEAIESQLEALGVDAAEQLEALLTVSVNREVVRLGELDEARLGALKLEQVEYLLQQQGVDVQQWLSRSEDLVRQARRGSLPAQGKDALSQRGRKRSLQGGSKNQGDARTHAGRSRASWRLTRRLSTAVAACFVVLAIGAVSFTVLQQEQSGGGITSQQPPTPTPYEMEPGSSWNLSTLAEAQLESSPPPNVKLKSDAQSKAQQNRAPAFDLARAVPPVAEEKSVALFKFEAQSTSTKEAERSVLNPSLLARRVAPAEEKRRAEKTVALSGSASADGVASRIDDTNIKSSVTEVTPPPPQVAMAPRPANRNGLRRQARSKQAFAPPAASAGAEKPTHFVIAPKASINALLRSLDLQSDDARQIRQLLSNLQSTRGGRLSLRRRGGLVYEATLERPPAVTIRLLRNAKGELQKQ